jgi:hypothetical protein
MLKRALGYCPGLATTLPAAGLEIIFVFQRRNELNIYIYIYIYIRKELIK